MRSLNLMMRNNRAKDTTMKKEIPNSTGLQQGKFLSPGGRKAPALANLAFQICFCLLTFFTLPSLAYLTPLWLQEWPWLPYYVPDIAMGNRDKELSLLVFLTFH